MPPVRRDDHVRGAPEDPFVVVYGDFTCPACATTHVRLTGVAVRRVFRHFALRDKHPRAPALAAAAEAAALQGAFWPFHDALYADQGHLDDPHLWARVTELGLDLERFERDRRAPAVRARIQRDVRDGLRAGIALTPTLVVDGEVVPAARTSAILDAFGS